MVAVLFRSGASSSSSGPTVKRRKAASSLTSSAPKQVTGYRVFYPDFDEPLGVDFRNWSDASQFARSVARHRSWSVLVPFTHFHRSGLRYWHRDQFTVRVDGKTQTVDGLGLGRLLGFPIAQAIITRCHPRSSPEGVE